MLKLPPIIAALQRVEAAHGVRVLFACESGSRAWGFPSPDSDYDVRFIYCHPAAWYLRLDEAADTLNFAVDAELDLAGWELRKFLRLLRGANAAALEWLQSPIIYAEQFDFRARLRPWLAACAPPQAGLAHYLGQLRRGVEEDLLGEQVRLKRLFYALRAALAARCLRERPANGPPPMEFGLLREWLPAALQMAVDQLLREKAAANEKTVIARPGTLVDFLTAEYATGLAARPQVRVEPRPSPTAAFDALFRQWLGEAFPGAELAPVGNYPN